MTDDQYRKCAQRTLIELAIQISNTIKHEIGARSHKQVRKYPNAFPPDKRAALNVSLDTLYGFRGKWFRTYNFLDGGALLLYTQSFRSTLEHLSTQFPLLEKKSREYLRQLAIIESGFRLLS